MKDKVKQLAEEAGFVLWGDEDWKPEGQVIDWSSVYDKELEKFAELIVRQCASQVDWILAEGGKTQGDLIKEHFGVEE